MNELKPCPLCGGEAGEKKTFDRFARGWIGCPKCKLYINWQVSDREAREKWNRRAEA